MFNVASKAYLPLVFALFMDGLQALLSVALVPVGGPIGIVLGFIVSACISLTFGVGLLILMALLGLFSFRATVGLFFGEVVPIFSALPMWTLLVLLSSVKALEKEGGAAGAMAATAGVVLQPTQAVPRVLRRGAVDGIRSASR